MKTRLHTLRAATIGGALSLGSSALLAQTSPAGAPKGSESAPKTATTSQCVEGPGAPPADPSKITRVVPGKNDQERAIDEPASQGAPAPVLLEGAIQAGVSVRVDEPPFLKAARRVGPSISGSLFVWPSRTLAFGASYTATDLGRTESAGTSIDAVTLTHTAHTLLAEARVVPFRVSQIAWFASIGGGLAWQDAALRATLIAIEGRPGGSFSCSAGSGAEFAFRAALGMKARVSYAASILVDASFVGYRMSTEVLDNCAPGAGTAQTLMLRAGLTYDLDISGLVR